MSLVLTQTCECAILVAIQQGRGFLHSAADHDISVQSKLDLMLPAAVDDLIPPKTVISTRPATVSSQGAIHLQSTLAYMMSDKLLHRLRSHDAQIQLTVYALSPFKPHFAIGTVSLHLSKAKVVVQRNGQRELNDVYQFVNDKGAWHSLDHRGEQIKAGLFIVAMPTDKRVMKQYSSPLLPSPVAAPTSGSQGSGGDHDDLELRSLSTEPLLPSPRSSSDTQPPPLYSDTNTTTTTTATTLLSSSSAYSRSSLKKDRPKSLTDAIVDRRRTSMLMAMKKRQIQDSKTTSIPVLARNPDNDEDGEECASEDETNQGKGERDAKDDQSQRSSRRGKADPKPAHVCEHAPHTCKEGEKCYNMEQLAKALQHINLFQFDGKPTPLPSSSTARRRQVVPRTPLPSVPTTPSYHRIKGNKVLRYHQVGRGSTPYTFYFHVVHADHLQPLLKPRSSRSRGTRKPFFHYSFLSTNVTCPASPQSSMPSTKPPASMAASSKIPPAGATLTTSTQPTCFHLRGHLVDIQQWLDEDQQRLQLSLMLWDDQSKDLIFSKEPVGMAHIPLNNLAYDLSAESRVYHDRPTPRRSSMIGRLINERSFPIYDLRRRHITHSTTGEIAKVTVRVGLVSGWWQDDEEEAIDSETKTDGGRSESGQSGRQPRMPIKRPNSRNHEIWDLFKNKKSKHASELGKSM